MRIDSSPAGLQIYCRSSCAKVYVVGPHFRSPAAALPPSCISLPRSGRTGVIASEEEDQPVAVEETFSGDYVVVFDPLDGSSNIDAGAGGRGGRAVGWVGRR